VLLGLDGSVKLLDFGIAKAAGDRSLTETGGFRGKVSYAAPEVLDGQAHEARSDLFALGAVMHEMLVGRRLFQGATDVETIGRVRAAAVRAPSEQVPNVPATLDAICLRALARLPGDRFDSAQALLAALDPVVHELQTGPEQLAAVVATGRSAPRTPAVAVPLPAPAAARRRPLIAVAAVLGVVAVAGGGLVLTKKNPSVEAPLVAAQGGPSLAREAPVEPPPPAPPPSAPPPAVQRLELKSNPPGATVKTRAGQVLGETPFKHEWPHGERPAVVVVERPGFIPATVQVPETDDAVEVVTLKHRARKRPGSPGVPNLEDGNVVDPFPHH
jgi:hypothetical protein